MIIATMSKRVGWDERTGEWLIAFPYDPEIVKQVRRIPGRRWERNAKTWRIRGASIRSIVLFVESTQGFILSDKAQERILGAGWVTVPVSPPEPLTDGTERSAER